MKKIVIGALVLTLVLCGCSKEKTETGDAAVTPEVSVTAEAQASKSVTESDSAKDASSDEESIDDEGSLEDSANSASSEKKSTSDASSEEKSANGASSEGRSVNNTPSVNDAANSVSSENKASSEKDGSLPFGVYAHTVNAVRGGESIHYKYIYSFHKDGTGMYYVCEEQGDALGEFTYNDKKLKTKNGDIYEYKLTGDHLWVGLPYGGGEFDKLPGDDFVLNGDFLEYAGEYYATDNSNNAFGCGDKLGNLVVDAGGSLTGGQPLSVKGNDAFPRVYPFGITKNADGSYHCELQYIDDASQSYYDIYPKGVIAEQDKDTSPELKDVVYIRAYRMDGGVYSPVFVKKDN